MRHGSCRTGESPFARSRRHQNQPEREAANPARARQRPAALKPMKATDSSAPATCRFSMPLTCRIQSGSTPNRGASSALVSTPAGTKCPNARILAKALPGLPLQIILDAFHRVESTRSQIGIGDGDAELLLDFRHHVGQRETNRDIRNRTDSHRDRASSSCPITSE